LDRTLALPISLERLGQTVDEPLFELSLARQGFRRRHFRHLDLMLEPCLLFVEGGRHREDRLSVLNSDYTAGGKASAIANPVHVVDDGQRGVAGQKEVSVKRMRQPAFPRAGRGAQGLADHLPAEHALPADLRAQAPEQILFEPLYIKD